MEITCKNCHQIYTGHYCNNCGQSAETHLINWHFLWHDIQHGLLHFDKGILYTVKQLFTRPGHSIREFIEGKRVRHFKPLSLVVVLATLYGVLYHFFHVDLVQTDSDNPLNLVKFNEWVSTHFSWVTIASIPLFTIGTYICFRNQGRNFVEYFVLNTFKASQKLVIGILLFPLAYFFSETPQIKTVTVVLYAIDLVLILWTNMQFFNKLSKTKVFFLSLLSHLIFLFLFFLIAAFVLWMTGNL
ncbi:DUF3667 domain-containing protein [Flavobacterium sp. FlaQc-52]|jgi:hypothetical protein|uniref:DUF3667 domain-containing protein n=1 Tax=Flavobacterium sp. FlaQc-52 TaxID=3374185 RepID=UPI003757B60A